MTPTIGGRYGYVDTSSTKSVTNLEYLAARAKGIPIFAFVQRSTLALVPIWKANPSADFSGAVDDARVLGFIDEIRTVHKVWTHEFDTAQEIVSALRARFAALTYDGLAWTRRLSNGALRPDTLKSLGARALRLALERPSAWEYKLLFQVVLDEIRALTSERQDHRLRLALGPATYVSHETLSKWTMQRMAELRAIANALDTLMAAPLEEALGPLGTPGDAEKILFIARRLGLAYAEAISWAQRVRRTQQRSRGAK